jgi:hypothetical protein
MKAKWLSFAWLGQRHLASLPLKILPIHYAYFIGHPHARARRVPRMPILHLGLLIFLSPDSGHAYPAASPL